MFIIEGKSSNLLNPFDVITLPLGYKSQLIPIDFGGYKVLVDDGSTPTVLARLYNASKTFIQDVAITIGEWYPFTTLYSSARYVELSFSNDTTPENVYFGQAEEFESWFNSIVNPMWNDLAMNFSKESQQEFFRRKLEGKMTFVRDDYEFIYHKWFGQNGNFDTPMKLSIFLADTHTRYWNGVFYATDCEISEDDKTIRVTPTSNDAYANVLSAMEKEFNLIDIQPAITPIHLDKRPIIQMYIQSGVMSPRITSFLGGNYWEQDCEYETSINRLTRNLHFFLNYAYCEMGLAFLSGGGVPYPVPQQAITGLWRGGIFTEEGLDLWRLYYSDDYYTYEWRQGEGTVIPKFRISQKSSGVTFWEGRMDFPNGSTYTISSPQGYADINVSLDAIDIIYARMLTDLERIGAENTYPFPDDDIAPNENYNRVLEVNLQGYINYTDSYSSSPTKWGRHDVNEYFTEPASSQVIPSWQPICQSAWLDNAYWLGIASTVALIDENGRTPIVLKDAYALEDVISALLSKTNAGIKLASNTFISYKQDNVWSAEIRKFFITPKSNMTNIDYDIPAQNAPISLKKIFDMLRDCYRAYWYIEGNELHIEQVEWFVRGGGYYPYTPDTWIDLTRCIVSRSGKAWAYGTSRYTFDKPDMTERYEFGWMDDESAPFNGEALNMVGNFVEKGKVEKISVQDFSADVDYIMANPNGVSPDGFVLMAAYQSSSDWYLPYKETGIGTNIILQNGYCAFCFLYVYYLQDIPSNKYRYGDGPEVSAGWSRKILSQDVNFPCPTDPDMKKLVKTFIGEGQFENLTINLSSRNGKATLKYTPERNE